MGAHLSAIDQSDYEQGPAALQINADYTLGPLLFGWSMNLFLCGVVVSWASRYASKCAGDRVQVKLAVALAVFFECATAGVNLISIIQHGKAQDRTNYAISLLNRADALGVTFGAIVAVSAQTFFASRCYRILPKIYQPFFAAWISLLIGAGFVGALGITIVEFINKGATDVTRGASPNAYNQLYYLAMIWLWSNAGADATISFLLMARLYLTRNAVARQSSAVADKTGQLITSLMRLTFETALATVLCSVLAGVLYVLTTTTTNLSYASSDMLPALYALSLLWALNSTHRLKEEVRPTNNAESIQLVWNLAGDGDRGATMQSLAKGEHISVSLRRSHAPAKATAMLGTKVKMLTIGNPRSESQVGADSAAEARPLAIDAEEPAADEYLTDEDKFRRESV